MLLRGWATAHPSDLTSSLPSTFHAGFLDVPSCLQWPSPVGKEKETSVNAGFQDLEVSVIPVGQLQTLAQGRNMMRSGMKELGWSS